MIPTRNHHVPAAGPDCAAYAPLLPLVAQRLLTRDEEASVQTHAASCSHCQALLAAYDRLDRALRLGMDHAARNAPSVEEIVETVENQESVASATPQAAEPARLRASRRAFSLIGAVAAVVMVALLAQALFASTGSSRAGSSRPSQGQPGTVSYNSLAADVTAIAMVSPSDGWLFGFMRSNVSPDSACSGCARFMLHYDGAHWQRLPAPTDKIVTAVSMVSSADGWAIAEDTILHYSGGTWSVAYTYTLPGHTVYLTAIAMASAADGWIGGSDSTTTSDSALMLHYTHGQWQRVTLAGVTNTSNPGINGISMLSPTEGWATSRQFVGDQAKALVLHYTRGQWQPVQTGFSGTLEGISALPDGEVWAVGYATGVTGMILYYDRGKWIQVASPTPNILHAITMRSSTDGWAVGDGAATLHWDGTQWTKVGLVIHGVALMSVSMPSAGEGWAIGGYESGDTSQPSIILHYSGGNWSVYDLKIGG